MKLIIVHFHLRPGGIRRIIELATPPIVRHFAGTIDRVVLATGEAEDRKWNCNFASLLDGTPVEFFTHSALGYFSEQKLAPARLRSRLRTALRELLAGVAPGDGLVWAHNPGIARNLILADELVRATAGRGLPLIAHHHDWWFDNRWLRWPEMRRCGVRTLADAAKLVLPAAGHLRHVAINRSDARVLERHFPRRSGWLPNLTERGTQPDASRERAAREWLKRKLNDADVPVWILPCRLLRRKNVAEALLLTRWLRPEAWLVTTGAASSADELHYFNKLSNAGHRHHWRMRLGILQGDETRKPSVAELLSASEAVLLTSIQEGFGLPYLEAAAAERPLIARKIPNVAPGLEQFGFRFPQYYDEVLVEPALFDWTAEALRQRTLYDAWKKHMPQSCRRIAGQSALLAAREPRPIPFSRLTLTAQLEVLAQPPRKSWERCAPLNPFLIVWKARAAKSALQVTPWPRRAAQWLSGTAYAKRFAEIVASSPTGTPNTDASREAQAQFIGEKLSAEHLFPLLWSRQS